MAERPWRRFGELGCEQVYGRSAGTWVYWAVAMMPRTTVPSGSRQVADRHGCPDWLAGAAPPPGRRILLIRTMSRPRMPAALAVSTCRPVPDGSLAVIADASAVREP